jgi:hypothetical protein
VLRRYFITFFIGFVLTGCADSETRSIVSSSDLSGSKYRRIAVFVENSNPAKSHTPVAVAIPNLPLTLMVPSPTGSATDDEIEQKIVSALGDIGIKASRGPTLFAGQTLSDQAKVAILQKGFDAVLYVIVLTNGMTEQRVAGASHNGQYITFGGGGPEPIDDYTLSSFDLKADGSVWSNVPTFNARCHLQDTKTSKAVWSSETIATGGTAVLLSRASEQIVAKMRSDGAI